MTACCHRAIFELKSVKTGEPLPIDAGSAIAILQQFREDARRTLNELRAAGSDHEFIEEMRKRYAEQESRLRQFAFDAAVPEELRGRQ
jgi:hypothetical protein